VHEGLEVKECLVKATSPATRTDEPTSHADFGAATHPGVGGGTHRRRATFERC